MHFYARNRLSRSVFRINNNAQPAAPPARKPEGGEKTWLGETDDIGRSLDTFSYETPNGQKCGKTLNGEGYMPHRTIRAVPMSDPAQQAQRMARQIRQDRLQCAQPCSAISNGYAVIICAERLGRTID